MADLFFPQSSKQLTSFNKEEEPGSISLIHEWLRYGIIWSVHWGIV